MRSPEGSSALEIPPVGPDQPDSENLTASPIPFIGDLRAKDGRSDQQRGNDRQRSAES